MLAGLIAQVPGLIAGAEEPDGLAFIDVDDTIGEVHGYAKQGAAYGYSKVRGLNAQIAAVLAPLSAPVIARAGCGRGNVAFAKGAGRLLAQAIRTARAAGIRARILSRADSAYYGWAFVGTALRHDTWFSVNARMTASVKTAISAINDEAWQAIECPNAVFDEAEQRWVSDVGGRRNRLRRFHRTPQLRTRRLSPDQLTTEGGWKNAIKPDAPVTIKKWSTKKQSTARVGRTLRISPTRSSAEETTYLWRIAGRTERYSRSLRLVPRMTGKKVTMVVTAANGEFRAKKVLRFGRVR